MKPFAQSAAATDPMGLEACGPVVGVLAEQVGETARQIEASVAQVCGSFQSIARRTQESAAHTRRALDHGGAGEGTDAVSTARGTIAALLERLDQARRVTAEAAEHLRRIEAIAAQVSRIQGALNEVDAVAHYLRIVALNAQIEAARLGGAGCTFGVVASETGAMAKSIGATAKSIRGMVDVLQCDVTDGTRRMRECFRSDQAATDLSRDEGARALEALTRTHAEMQTLLSEAAGNSAQLAEDISDAMTALQFQDAVNQRLEHVASALRDVQAALPETDKSSRWAERLRDQYTMRSERELLNRVLDEGDGVEDSAPGSIELF